MEASGCADLVANTNDEFIQISAKLAADSARIVEYRKKLRGMMVEYGFGDGARFARAIEGAYDDMLKRAFDPKRRRKAP
ncbi:MAG: hypothetical protein R3C27_14355 [Hyphomonadaceae bacterium]